MKQILQGILAACVLAAIALCGVWGGGLCPGDNEERPAAEVTPGLETPFAPVQANEEAPGVPEGDGAQREFEEAERETGFESVRG